MNLVKRYLNYPHLILSVVFLGIVLGAVSFRNLPLNLFPDANYPAVSVLLIWQGASADDVESRVTRQVETELAGLGQSRKIKSVTRDEVAAVTVEFDYQKGINAAVTDVSAALDRVRALLPSDILSPRIFKITDATAPVATLSVKPASTELDMVKVRQICDNDLREALLRLPEVAQVEVFGGYQPEVQVALDPIRMQAYNITVGDITTSIALQNRNIPGGTLIRDRKQLILKIEGERLSQEKLLGIVIKTGNDQSIHLRDVATISLNAKDRFSFFHGNGSPAVGINILRTDTGHVTSTLASLNKALPQIKNQFANLSIEIVDTSGDIIETSISNMIGALRDAVLLTVGVIFLLLAKPRTTLLTSISIPFTFLLTFAAMGLIGLELNIVTMTGIILAVGLLVDDSIVVIENIDRHMRMPGKTPKQAAIDGTDEIYLADFSGTLTTLVVLLPVMFVSGYTQKILRPLALTLTLALFFSFIVSVTVIPLFAPYLQGGSKWENYLSRILYRLSEKILSPMRHLFSRLFLLAEKRRFVFILVGILLFIVSMRQMPLVGRDLMPPMDTGIVKINFDTGSDTPIEQTEKTALAMEAVIRKEPGFLRMSAVAGSESGVISFGAERTAQAGTITAHFVNRFNRDMSIWDIEMHLRKQFASIPGLKSFQVFDYGATPLSSINAPIDVQIAGPDPMVLNEIADAVEKRLGNVRGLTDITRSWETNKKEWTLVLIPEELNRYGLTPMSVGEALNAATQGIQASSIRVPGQLGFAVTVKYDSISLNSIEDLKRLTVSSPKGPVPIEQLGRFKSTWQQSRLIREDLQSVVDVYGYRAKTAISHIQEQVDAVLSDLALPAGYHMVQKGEIANMTESFSNLGKAMAISIILVYFTMVTPFKSFLHPITIMIAIPLAFIGISWTMLIMGKHFCMPASMGMILLAGIVVNNSILLIDFIQTAREQGKNRQEAIMGAIRTRTRPIIMTATSTIVGMLPIALEMAVGLERLSPLAVVAIGGLFVSTILTLLYIPIFYTVSDDITNFLMKLRKS